ncbi:MAG: hypothetical protein ACRD04_04115 [Terriglobales bacterium]
MRITFDIPDPLYRKLKAKATSQGQSVGLRAVLAVGWDGTE